MSTTQNKVAGAQRLTHENNSDFWTGGQQIPLRGCRASKHDEIEVKLTMKLGVEIGAEETGEVSGEERNCDENSKRRPKENKTSPFFHRFKR